MLCLWPWPYALTQFCLEPPCGSLWHGWRAWRGISWNHQPSINEHDDTLRREMGDETHITPQYAMMKAVMCAGRRSIWVPLRRLVKGTANCPTKSFLAVWSWSSTTKRTRASSGTCSWKLRVQSHRGLKPVEGAQELWIHYPVQCFSNEVITAIGRKYIIDLCCRMRPSLASVLSNYCKTKR